MRDGRLQAASEGGRLWPRAAATKEAARAIKDGGVGTLSGRRVLWPDGVSGRGWRAAVWESEWQWRIERANVLRMNGPNSASELGLVGVACAREHGQE